MSPTRGVKIRGEGVAGGHVILSVLGVSSVHPVTQKMALVPKRIPSSRVWTLLVPAAAVGK